MEVGINNKYSSFFTQILNSKNSNTSLNNINASFNNMVCNINSSNSTNTEEYFKNICLKYSDVNIIISDSYLSEKDKVTINISPEFINKSNNSSEAEETLKRVLDKVPDVTKYIRDNQYTLDSREVKNVSILIDKNGSVSCKCDFLENDSEKKNKASSEDTDSEINLSTYNRFQEDSKIQVWVSVKYLAEAVYNPSTAKKLDDLLDDLEKQMSSFCDYINGLSDILTGKEAKDTKVEIDENGKCSFNIDFEERNSREVSKIDSENKQIEKQIENRETLKEAKIATFKAITDKKLNYYYNV